MNQLPPADHTLPKTLEEKDLPIPHDMLLNPTSSNSALHAEKPHITQKHSWLHWMPAIIGLIIGLLVGGSFLGGAMTGKGQVKPYTDPPAAALTSLITPPLLADNMSTWKTYANPNISYSFKYPKNAIIHEGNMIMLQMAGSTQKSGTELTDGISLQFSLPFFVTTDLKQYVEEQKNNMNQVVINPIQEIQVGGTKAYAFTTQGQTTLRYIYVQNPYAINNFIYIVDATRDPTNQGLSDIVNNILSTFQFTNPSTTTMPKTPITGGAQACTDDAKVCSDGSVVGRTGPNCEFPACPGQ